MILNATTQTLEIDLAAARATANASVTVSYVTFTSSTTTPATQISTTNGVTAVTILSAPADNSSPRKVNGITVCNEDTAAITVTIQFNQSASLFPIVNAVVVPVNASLQFQDGRGWSLIDSTGRFYQALAAPPSDVQSFVGSAGGTWTKPAGAQIVAVNCTGGGGSGGGGEGRASGARAGGGAGGGGFRVVRVFNAADLAATVAVTIAASATSAAGGATNNGTNGAAGPNANFGTVVIGYGGGGGAGGGQTAGTGGGSGGGGGATGAGANSTTSTGAVGGTAMLAGGAININIPDARGAGGGTGGTGPAAPGDRKSVV